MDKFEYLSQMFNQRTNRKKYENYVVDAIYNRIGNSELVPVTQQFVRNPNDSRRYYLLDLYFPQLNYGIEVDEGYHLKNKESDVIREQDIRSAISCDEGRISIFKVANEKPQMQSFDEIESQINEQVKIIKEKIKTKGKLKWETNEDLKQNVITKGVFSVSDNVDYGGITEIYRITGHNAKQLRRCFYKLNENYYLWVPTLAIKLEDGKIKSSNNYENYLTEAHDEIIEYDKTKKRFNLNEKKWDGERKRVVFMKMRDRFGKNCIKFVGVFENDRIENGGRHYKRISESVEIGDLKK
jgi:hypothetical protein